MTTITKVLLRSTLMLGLSLVLPATGSAHDGALDVYGCHQDNEQKSYHCHEGVFKGGSFPSKIEMIRLLRIQFRNLGRPWPYGPVAEEDITSPPQEVQQ